MLPASRYANIHLSLIRQINALATPFSVNLGIGEPNIEPDETLRRMAAEVAASGPWHYSPNPGFLPLRKKLAAGFETEIDPEREICVTAGTQEGLFAVLHAFVDAGDEVLVPDPGFLAYPTLVRLCGGIPVAYRHEPGPWSVDVDDLESKITPRTKAIVINSPSNPTGAAIEEGPLQRLVRLADEHDLLLIADEVYREIHYDRAPSSLLGRSRNAIVLNGFSKSHSMTGLRLGWVVADQRLMATIVKAHQYVATCASVFSQQLALRILEQDEWNRQWLESIRTRFRAQRQTALAMVERYLGVPVDPPSGAFYLFAPIPLCDSIAVAKALATDAAVLTIPGVAFGATGEGFLRISYAASTEAIGQGIERIGRYFKERGW